MLLPALLGAAAAAYAADPALKPLDNATPLDNGTPLDNAAPLVPPVTATGQVRASSQRNQWREELEKSGILNRNGPYRLALPLASFGDDGPKLLFTYVPRLKDDTGSRVFMFFLKMDLE